jgi:hypothetical protein
MYQKIRGAERERERERVHLENFNLRGTIFGWEKMSR